MIILAAISINAIVGTNMINTAVSGVDNYVEAGEIENQIMENVVDYLDSVVASISKEPQTFTDEEIAELIGKYVDYTPTSGTYKTVTDNATYTGTDANSSDFTTDTNLHWRIWSIENGKLTLIADDVQSSGGYNNAGQLYLYGSVGYNNGVKLLNDICKTLYSNSNIGATGRSLDIVDIEEVLDWNVWKPTDFYYTSEISSYAYTSSYKYETNKYYPYLWQYEDYSNIDETTISASYTYDSGTGTLTYTGAGLRRNEQTSLIPDTTGTYLQASEYIQPTENYWYKALETSNFTNSEYYYLIYKSANNNTTNLVDYLLASRFIFIDSWSASYGLQFVSGGILNGFALIASSLQQRERGYAFRPVVEISLSSVTLDTETTSGDDVANALQLIAR